MCYVVTKREASQVITNKPTIRLWVNNQNKSQAKIRKINIYLYESRGFQCSNNLDCGPLGSITLDSFIFTDVSKQPLAKAEETCDSLRRHNPCNHDLTKKRLRQVDHGL